MSTEFYQTQMGDKFFNQQLPQLIYAIEKLGNLKETEISNASANIKQKTEGEILFGNPEYHRHFIRQMVLGHPYMAFSEHKDLSALAICADVWYEKVFGSESTDMLDFEEIVFVVEKEWLENFCKDTFEIEPEDLQRWLQEEYDSYDSMRIFNVAVKAGKVVMVDFD